MIYDPNFSLELKVRQLFAQNSASGGVAYFIASTLYQQAGHLPADSQPNTLVDRAFRFTFGSRRVEVTLLG